ncbi:MAG: DUF5677 domain-containing protein [Pseudomonadota bacterium]|nr:DUF5677 domain-containing protein [Pseudomonadota bacterium]
MRSETSNMPSSNLLSTRIKWANSVVANVHAKVLKSVEQHPDLAEQQEWLILRNMYERSHEHTEGAVSCLTMGNVASAEALCRTSLESSVTLYYVSVNDIIPAVAGYFQRYIDSEKEQNRKWHNSIEASVFDDAVKSAHRAELAKKDSALEQYERELGAWLHQTSNVSLATSPQWPNIFDRFKEIGKELSYRTVYAALCSQSHADAEDILNHLMSRLIPSNTFDRDQYHKMLQRENAWFSSFMVVIAIKEYIEATAMFLGKFNICPLQYFQTLNMEAQGVKASLVDEQDKFITGAIHA